MMFYKIKKISIYCFCLSIFACVGSENDTGDSTSSNAGNCSTNDSCSQSSNGDSSSSTPQEIDFSNHISKGEENDFSGTESPCLDTPLESGYCLVWHDEFDGDSVDLSKWSFEHNCYGGGNGESQCYVQRDENTLVDGDYLHIKAKRECTWGPRAHDDHDGYDPNDRLGGGMYTSARMRTWYKGDWKYGRFDIRAKLPEGQGTWPAIWMLPSDWEYGGWAASGEIDIMEAVNLKVDGENKIHGTLHFGDDWPRNVYSGEEYALPSGDNPADGFHVYSIEWEEGEIRWYIDNDHYATQTHEGWYSNADLGNSFAPFDKRFHLLINFAIGGNFAGSSNRGGIDASVFPQEFIIDYVRVYQCENDRETGKGCGSSDGDFIASSGITPPKNIDTSAEEVHIFDGAAVEPYAYGFWAYPGAVHGRIRMEDQPYGSVMNLQFDADNGVAYFAVNRGVDFSSFRHIEFDVRVTEDTRENKTNLEFRADCLDPCRSGQIDIGYPEDWTHVMVPMDDLVASGLDPTRVSAPFVISAEVGNQRGLTIQVDNIKLTK